LLPRCRLDPAPSSPHLVLREHAEVDDVTHVRLAVLETDGTVSIVPMSADVQQSQTKVTTR